MTYGILTLNNNYKVVSFEYSSVMYISIHESICYDNDTNVKECPLSLEKLCELKNQLINDLAVMEKFNTDYFNDHFKIYTILQSS